MYLVYYIKYLFKSVPRVGSIILFYILLYWFKNMGSSVFFNYVYVSFWYFYASIVRILCNMVRTIGIILSLVINYYYLAFNFKNYILMLCVIIYYNIMHE